MNKLQEITAINFNFHKGEISRGDWVTIEGCVTAYHAVSVKSKQERFVSYSFITKQFAIYQRCQTHRNASILTKVDGGMA